MIWLVGDYLIMVDIHTPISPRSAIMPIVTPSPNDATAAPAQKPQAEEGASYTVLQPMTKVTKMQLKRTHLSTLTEGKEISLHRPSVLQPPKILALQIRNLIISIARTPVPAALITSIRPMCGQIHLVQRDAAVTGRARPRARVSECGI